MTGAPGLDRAGLDRLHHPLAAPVERGAVPALVALVARGDDVHTEVLGSAALGDPVETYLPELADRRVLRSLGAHGWGYGMAAPGPLAGEPPIPWGFGWNGGTGTAWSSDPGRGLTGILLTTRAMTSPEPPPHVVDFWDAAYGALGD